MGLERVKSRETSCSTVAIPEPMTITTTHNINRFMNDKPYFFLLHVTDPSVKKDKLAIAETADCSIRRNLSTTTYSAHSPLQFFIDDIVDPELLTFSGSMAEDDYQLDEFITDAAFSSKLPNQLHEIATELVETSRSMSLESENRQEILTITELDSLFTLSNLSIYITAYFRSLHWYLPIVHCPTFDPARVSNCLLLAIFLAGAVYSGSFDRADLPSTLLSVAEEYIFRRIANLSTTLHPSSDQPLRGTTIETIQAALIIEMLQFSQGDPQIRRRIRIVRHPCLVSTIRSLGLFHYKRKTAVVVCDEGEWNKLIDEEMCIR